MTNSVGKECERAIDVLLLPKTDQQALKKLFNVQGVTNDVQVILNAAARELVKAQR